MLAGALWLKVYVATQIWIYWRSICLTGMFVCVCVCVCVQAVLWDFQYGAQYAWMLCIFAIIVSFSIPCPLVTPFGKVFGQCLFVVLFHNNIDDDDY